MTSSCNMPTQCSAALLCAVLAFTSNAQVPATSLAAKPVTADGEAPQVVVTGSRFEESYDAGRPIGVTVITAHEIERSGVTTIYEALGRLGGVYTRNSLGGIDEQVDLRGFGITGDQNTLVLIDGQRVSENELQPARLSGVPLNAIERIEIVRGSGAVLYGGGATGGVINVITKSPAASKPYVNAAVLGGSFGTSDLRLDAGLGHGPILLDFAANRYSTDNYRRNNAADQENASARIRFVGADGEVSLRVASERQHVRFPGSLTLAQYSSDPRQASTPADYGDTDANHYAVAAKYRFSWGEVALDGYRRDKVNRALFVSAFGGFFRRSGTSTDAASPRVLVSLPIFGIENRLVVGHENVRWSYLSQSTFIFGGAAGEVDLGNANFNAFNSADLSARQFNRAWYFRDEMRLGNLRVALGARRESLLQVKNDAFSAAQNQQGARNLHAEELGLAWAPDPRWIVHGRAGHSFRVANVDDNAFLPALLQPQTSNDGELGVSYQERTGGIDARVFRHRLNNEIMCTPVAPPFCTNINLPPTERSGIEITAKWRLSPALSVSTFASHMRARFRAGIAGGPDLTGREVPLVPRTRVTLQADWRLSSVDVFNAGLRYVGSQIYDNDQLNALGSRMPAYTTVDVKYTRKFGNVDLSAAITNLGNRGYYSYGIVSGAGAINVYPERRRAIFVGMAVRY